MFLRNICSYFITDATLYFCSQINVGYQARAEIHEMPVGIANREEPDQIASSEAI